MQELNKVIKINLPLTDAEKVCLAAYISIYPKACNYVSKYVYKKKVHSQSELLNLLSCELRDRYKLNRSGCKSVIKTVLLKYKEREKLGKCRKLIKFRRKDHMFHWGIDYILTNERFYINTINEKVKCAPDNYEKYFGIAPVFFISAKVLKRIGGYYIRIPVIIDTGDVSKERFLVEIALWLLWKPVQRTLLTK